MLSKLVAEREASDREVLAAVETHGLAAAPRLMDLLKPYLKAGEGAPDLGLFMTLLARMLADRSGAMSAADRAHDRELGDDGPARDGQDLVAARLSTLISRAAPPPPPSSGASSAPRRPRNRLTARRPRSPWP